MRADNGSKILAARVHAGPASTRRNRSRAMDMITTSLVERRRTHHMETEDTTDAPAEAAARSLPSGPGASAASRRAWPLCHDPVCAAGGPECSIWRAGHLGPAVADG